jgi:hypothetical protein
MGIAAVMISLPSQMRDFLPMGVSPLGGFALLLEISG